MSFDPDNPVIALCAAGMAAEGTPAEARVLFERAWAARRDDYEAAIAAHYLARHQATAAATLHWNALAVTHLERIADERAGDLGASLYLNLAHSLLAAGRRTEAKAAAARSTQHVQALSPGGYRQLIEQGIARVAADVTSPIASPPNASGMGGR
jgi:hypothetical protein